MRSAMPGKPASGRWVPSNTRCSYTSSVTTRRSRSMASSAIAASSASVNTLPVGLCGVFRRSRRVRGVIAAASGVEVDDEAGRSERDHAEPGPRHRHRRAVGVVGGLEGDHLVAGLAEREERGGDGLGGAGRHEDLGVGIDGEAPEATLVLGDGPTQLRGARTGRVLVVAGADGGDGGLEHLGRAVGVREPLPEVDGPGGVGQRRHLGEDRRPEPLEVARQSRDSAAHLRDRSGARPTTPSTEQQLDGGDEAEGDDHAPEHGGPQAQGEPGAGVAPDQAGDGEDARGPPGHVGR